MRPAVIVLLDPTGDRGPRFLQAAMEPFDVAVAFRVMIVEAHGNFTGERRRAGDRRVRCQQQSPGIGRTVSLVRRESAFVVLISQGNGGGVTLATAKTLRTSHVSHP